MESVFKTDKGLVRQHNEDSGGIFRNSSGDLLAIVADGMGGHNAGDVASEMTIKELQKEWQQTEMISTPDKAEEWLKTAIVKVNEKILSHSRENIECSGMGTTIVAAVCTSRFCTIANIGDSRCYILNENGFQKLTEDHSLVNELVRTGQITKEDAEHHPRKNVLTKALGTEEEVAADVLSITFEDDDYLLLCSDGLSNKVSEAKMEEVIKGELPLAEKAQTLIDLANQEGGEDNITIVILHQTAGSESG